MNKSIVSLWILTIYLGTQVVLADDPKRFSPFLLNNKWASGLPLSYKVPENYWKNVPPINTTTNSAYTPQCGRVSTAAELNAYTAQTEQYLTSSGVNLYDAAVREIALTLLGEGAVAQAYEVNTLIAGKTLQFNSIRGDAPCKGIIYWNQCQDTNSDGGCGFCYAGNDNNHQGVSVPTDSAYFFRMIGDVYAYGGTVDQRCPEKNIQWTWNDWRPVAGENAWANFLGPLQTAYIQAQRKVDLIPDDAPAMLLATRMFSTFQKMQMPNGAIAYAPWNTYDGGNPALGGTASTENAASALGGMKALLYIIQNKQSSQYKALAPQITKVMQALTEFIKSAYSPSLGYFRQGGTYTKNGWQWNSDPNSQFAVDCQTWVISVIGANQVDSWFGAGTTVKIWSNTKKLGGYYYDASSNTARGLGFSMNQQVQVFSGEWSFGGVNMLRIIAAQLPSSRQSLLDEADDMRQAIDDYLTVHDTSMNSDVVWYSNKRYYIPFGWWANPIPSLASISWAVMVDSNYNPFFMGGAYSS